MTVKTFAMGKPWLAYRLLSAVAALIVVSAVVAPSHALAHHAGGTARIVEGDLQPGGSVTIVGDGFPGDEFVTVTLESGTGGIVPLGVKQASPAGEFVITATLPHDIETGAWKLAVAFADDKNFTDVTVGPPSGDQAVSIGTGEPHESMASGTQVVFERSLAESVTIGIIVGALIISGTILVLAGTRQRA